MSVANPPCTCYPVSCFPSLRSGASSFPCGGRTATVARDLVRLRPCGHTFGMQCALGLLTNERCSVCGTPFDATGIVPDDASRKIIANLVAKCLAAPRCPWTGPLGERDAHSYGPRCAVPHITCPFCNQRMEQGKPYEDHKPLCPEAIVLCPKCEADVPRQRLSRHLTRECTGEPPLPLRRRPAAPTTATTAAVAPPPRDGVAKEATAKPPSQPPSPNHSAAAVARPSPSDERVRAAVSSKLPDISPRRAAMGSATDAATTGVAVNSSIYRAGAATTAGRDAPRPHTQASGEGITKGTPPCETASGADPPPRAFSAATPSHSAKSRRRRRNGGSKAVAVGDSNNNIHGGSTRHTAGGTDGSTDVGRRLAYEEDVDATTTSVDSGGGGPTAVASSTRQQPPPSRRLEATVAAATAAAGLAAPPPTSSSSIAMVPAALVESLTNELAAVKQRCVRLENALADVRNAEADLRTQFLNHLRQCTMVSAGGASVQGVREGTIGGNPNKPGSVAFACDAPLSPAAATAGAKHEKNDVANNATARASPTQRGHAAPQSSVPTKGEGATPRLGTAARAPPWAAATPADITALRANPFYAKQLASAMGNSAPAGAATPRQTSAAPTPSAEPHKARPVSAAAATTTTSSELRAASGGPPSVHTTTAPAATAAPGGSKKRVELNIADAISAPNNFASSSMKSTASGASNPFSSSGATSPSVGPASPLSASDRSAAHSHSHNNKPHRHPVAAQPPSALISSSSSPSAASTVRSAKKAPPRVIPPRAPATPAASTAASGDGGAPAAGPLRGSNGAAGPPSGGGALRHGVNSR